MAKNDLAVWLRSPAAIAAALLPALGMGMLVAMLTVSVGRQPVALVVEEQGRHAARMARIITGDEDAYLLEQMSAADAERAFGEQRVAAIIVIPENFDWAAARSEAIVDLYLNNVNVEQYKGPGSYDKAEMLVGVQDAGYNFRWFSDMVRITVGEGEKFVEIRPVRLEPLPPVEPPDIEVAGRLWCRPAAGSTSGAGG